MNSAPTDTLGKRLLARRSEIERATLSRVYGVCDPTATDDPSYLVGLRATVSAALTCGIAALDRGDARAVPIPRRLATQARQAARNKIPLDAVLRRYFGGYALLCDFIVEEAKNPSSKIGVELQEGLRIEGALLDRFLVVVTTEYREEIEERVPRSSEQRRVERVGDLLAGKLVDVKELSYPIEAWHLGGVVAGNGHSRPIRKLAAELDASSLVVQPNESESWFWLGGKHKVSSREAICLARDTLPAETTLAVGEPGSGVEGWRETHRQASAAMPVALRSVEKKVRYAEVALVASALQDDVLMRTLQDLYIVPLSESRDGGQTLRRTLERYFESDRTTSSAAALLGVSRRTVANRLRVIEDLLGRSLASCSAEIEAALRLASLDETSSE